MSLALNYDMPLRAIWNTALTQEKAAIDGAGQEIMAEAGDVAPARGPVYQALAKPFPPVIADQELLERLFVAGELNSASDEIELLKARRELVRHQIQSKMALINMLTSAEPESMTNAAMEGQISAEEDDEELALWSAFSDVLSEEAEEELRRVYSSRELNAQVAKAIDVMAEEYLGVFQQAMEKSIAFYREFTDFIASLSSFIRASDSDTILDADGFKAKLEELMGAYGFSEKGIPDASITLFPTGATDPVTSGASKEECEAWAREMGLSVDKCVSKIPGTDQYVVHIDVTPLNTILESIKAREINEDGETSFNSASWSAWQNGLDIQKDTIQTGIQALTQRFSNANSTFDNLIKVLSSTISSLLECDKSFLHI